MAHHDAAVAQQPGGLTAAWNALTAALGVVMGLAPHVLRHVGLLAGAALVSGLVGNLAFALVGLLLSIPLLRRLYRRFGTWRAPAIAVLALRCDVHVVVTGHRAGHQRQFLDRPGTRPRRACAISRPRAR